MGVFRFVYYVLTLALAIALMSVGVYKFQYADGDGLFEGRFKQYASVFPGNGLHPSVTPTVDPVILRKVVGAVEVFTSLFSLGLLGGTLASLAAVVQVLLFVGAAYTHVSLDQIDDMGLAGGMCALCIIRYAFMPLRRRKPRFDEF